MQECKEKDKIIIRDKVIEIINKKLLEGGECGLEVEISDSSALELYGIDSLSFVNLVVELEIAFGIEFDDEDLVMEKFNTIDLIYALVQERK
ncbi:acyl carrier protein [compost metagenome]